MRILLNTYPVAFDCPGGGEVQLLESKNALERQGHQVLLYDLWHPQLGQADVVHYFSVQGGSMNFCAHVRRRRLPLLISPILWISPENAGQFPLAEIHDLLHLCDAILPNSRAEAEALSSFFGIAPGRMFVTHNAADPAFGRDVPPELFTNAFDIREPFILNVANIEPRKNQLGLIRAVHGLGLRLVLAGQVRDEAYWRECQAQGGDTVTFLGPLEHSSDLLKSAYRACAVFVLPSLVETPGLAALEAAAAGARVVVTAVGCSREYFADLATYVNPQDDEDVRSGIRRALAQDRDTNLARHVLSNFTWDHTAHQLVEAYHAALSQSAASRGPLLA